MGGVKRLLEPDDCKDGQAESIGIHEDRHWQFPNPRQEECAYRRDRGHGEIAGVRNPEDRLNPKDDIPQRAASERRYATQHHHTENIHSLPAGRERAGDREDRGAGKIQNVHDNIHISSPKRPGNILR